MGRSHPIIAAIYDRVRESEERNFFGKLREKIVGLAEGTVVEVGVGTGLNFSHYRSAAVRRLYAVEPDPCMRRRAERQAAGVSFPVEFVEGTAERLPLPDGSADTVVATLLLCSVDEPREAGQEMRRVLRPSGKLLLIEHVRADGPWRARLQDWLTPFWRRVAANCHPNRPSLVLLGDAGFAVQEMRRISTGLRLERPIVAGIASRQDRPAFAP